MTIEDMQPGDSPAAFALRRGTPLYFTFAVFGGGDLIVAAHDASYGPSPDGSPFHDMLFASRIEPDNAETMLVLLLDAVRAQRFHRITLEATGVVPGRYTPVGGAATFQVVDSPEPAAPTDTDEGGHA